MLLVKIKDFNTLIENKPVFDQPVKTNKKRIKNLSKCQEVVTKAGNLLDFSCHQNNHKLIEIDLSRQENTSALQLINFTGKS